MPPKKKSKGAAPAQSTPATDDNAMAIDTPESAGSAEPHDHMKDPWTDEQETSLFKGLIKWKPAGMHKHFRMIALSGYLRNHGYDPQIETHTRIPGIWKKLGTLYNMPVIDERENSFDYDDIVEEKYLEFKLPFDDFKGLMWEQGKTSVAGTSPPRLCDRSTRSPSLPAPTTRKRKRVEPIPKNRASTVTDTDEARTSPANSPTPKTKRSGRNVRSAGKVKAESSSRAQSKDTTMDEDEGEENVEGAEDETQDGDEESTESPRPTKGSSKTKPGAAKATGSTRKSGRKR